MPGRFKVSLLEYTRCAIINHCIIACCIFGNNLVNDEKLNEKFIYGSQRLLLRLSLARKRVLIDVHSFIKRIVQSNGSALTVLDLRSE